DQQTGVIALVLIAFSLLLLYSRFVEPNWLLMRQTRIALDTPQRLAQPVTVALVADIHLGLFSGQAKQLRRIAKAVNAAQPDLVLFAGDWTYEPNRGDLAQQFAALQHIHAPMYSVLGNHDEELPGPPLQQALRAALASLGIADLEGQIVDLAEVRLLGTGDLWAGKADLAGLSALPHDKPWLVMAHNPDTVSQIPSLPARPLMVAGHTHGGQVNLPYLTAWVLRKTSQLGCKEGLYQQPTAQVFVTAGTGLVGLPLRFGMPPRIDLLTLY
ncbi:MAG: metallophosphoesterase, partial [Pseudomonadota bacterium]|nr:metallophosphoesterase [Pseudomonadota bacterium]